MKIHPFVVVALRVVLAGFFALLVVFETLAVPGSFAYDAKQHPDQAFVRWLLTSVAIVIVVCVQVVIVATWRLLTLVRRDRIFSQPAMIWADVMVWTTALACVVLCGLLVFAVIAAEDPGPKMILALATAAAWSIALVMAVLRGLLREATRLRTDMDAVI